MNWELVGAIAELLGAIAVVGSVAYLARQIKQQNKIAKFDAAQAVFREFNEINNIYLQDAKMVRILTEGMKDPSTLDDEEAGQFQFILRRYFNSMMMAYKAYLAGLFPEDDWDEIAKHYAADMNTAGGRLWRETNSETFSDFFELIDQYQSQAITTDFSLGRDSPDRKTST